MSSRRDQIQSYQFFMQRVISAFVAREPDPQQTPFRRLGGAGLGGVMVAIIAMAAVGIFGFIFPGGATGWKDGRSVIQEKGTGALYVYRDGRLHPVENYASALLALGTSAPTKMVSPNSLVGTPRGVRIGIPGAPAALPKSNRILRGAWSLCSQPARDTTGSAVATTALTVGRAPSGGSDLGDRAVLARDSRSGALYLIWHDHRYAITSEDTVLEGLALRSEPVLLVGQAWLNALPGGQAIGTRQLAGRGQPSRALAGALVGQVYVVRTQSGSGQFYLVEAATLTPITALQADIVLADAATRAAYPGGQPAEKELAAATAAGAPKGAPVGTGADQPPSTRPEIARVAGDRSAVCAAYAPGADEPTVLVDPDIPAVADAVATSEQTGDGTPLADRVIIEPGYGALVEAVPSPGASGGVVNLVTDLGIRYPLASDAVAAMLGYGKIRPVRLPASLVVRLPSGPGLDPVAATRPV